MPLSNHTKTRLSPIVSEVCGKCLVMPLTTKASAIFKLWGYRVSGISEFQRFRAFYLGIFQNELYTIILLKEFFNSKIMGIL